LLERSSEKVTSTDTARRFDFITPFWGDPTPAARLVMLGWLLVVPNPKREVATANPLSVLFQHGCQNMLRPWGASPHKHSSHSTRNGQRLLLLLPPLILGYLQLGNSCDGHEQSSALGSNCWCENTKPNFWLSTLFVQPDLVRTDFESR